MSNFCDKTFVSWFFSRSKTSTDTPMSMCRYRISLRWRHNGRDSVSNHQPHDCLLNRLFRRRSKKTPKLRVTGLCVGNSPGTGELPAQMASNAENVSIWWRLHVYGICHDTCPEAPDIYLIVIAWAYVGPDLPQSMAYLGHNESRVSFNLPKPSMVITQTFKPFKKVLEPITFALGQHLMNHPRPHQLSLFTEQAVIWIKIFLISDSYGSLIFHIYFRLYLEFYKNALHGPMYQDLSLIHVHMNDGKYM